MIARRCRRLLLSLAFAGSLLLGLVPSLGRLYQAFAQDPLAAQLGQMCTAEGLVARADLSRWSAATAGNAGEPAPRHPGDDCDYCPLLVAPALPVATLVVLPAPRFPQVAFPAPALPALPQRHLLGWAPRGPPVSIAV